MRVLDRGVVARRGRFGGVIDLRAGAGATATGVNPRQELTLTAIAAQSPNRESLWCCLRRPRRSTWPVCCRR